MKEYRMIRILAAVVGVLAVLAACMYDNIATYILCCLLFLAALGIFIYSVYYYGKYLILNCNASVTESTQKKVEKNSMKTIVKVLVCSFFLSIVFMIVLMFLPDLPEYRPGTWEKKQEQEEVHMSTGQRETAETNGEEKKTKEESLLARILRYVLLSVCAVLTVVLLGAALYKLFGFLSHRNGKTGYEYKEQIIEVNDIDEYTTFTPIVKKRVHFPDGNNGKVRRQFYRQVKQGAGKKAVDKSRTPQELEQEYMKPLEGNRQLVSLYEKARYSQETVTDEEWYQWEQRKKKEQGGIE